MRGVIKNDIELLSTSLRLFRGQVVDILPADNLPQGGYFARPADGKWSDGIEHNVDDSIHVTEDDIER